ncbi:MAG: deoxyribose-phosphate aldolase [Eubacteriales bacterium]
MDMNLTVDALANMIDHTLLKSFVTNKEFKILCDEAKKHGFKMVAVNPGMIELCKEYLKGTSVHVGAAISFPLGQNTIECKIFETKDSIRRGCDEIDYVINILQLKNGNFAYVENEMKEIVEICREHNIISKAILENCYLTDEEKKIVCEIALKVKPDFIKTSTGFGTSGATIEDVKLMKSVVGNGIKIKAAGGIKDIDLFLSLIDAGAERIGISSSVKILNEYKEKIRLSSFRA